PQGERLRRRCGVRRVRRVRQGRRDQLPAGPVGPTEATAAPRGRGRLPVRHRHRRARTRAARLVALRLRAGRPVRGTGGARRQYLAGSAATEMDRLARSLSHSPSVVAMPASTEVEGYDRNLAGFGRRVPGKVGLVGQIDDLANRYVDEWAPLDPLSATFVGIAGFDHDLGDLTPEGYAALADLDRRTLDELRGIEPD